MAVFKKVGKVIVCLCAAAFVALSAWHLYVDHQLLHVLVSIESARQKQFQAQGK